MNSCNVLRDLRTGRTSALWNPLAHLIRCILRILIDTDGATFLACPIVQFTVGRIADITDRAFSLVCDV